jgi:uncharacterized protein (TIGR03435 family)
MPVYALVRANADGRLGPHLRQATNGCPAVPDKPEKRADTAPPREPVCWGGNFHNGSIRAGAITMVGIATHFTDASLTERIVVDRTGLPGIYEIDLRWSASGLDAGVSSTTTVSEPSKYPSLFTAVQEQLGLKLEPRSELLDVLVVDRAEQPTPN